MKKISILLLFALVACLFTNDIHAAGPRAKQRPKHVVLIAFDGLSAIGVRNHPMPNFNRLMEEGAYTLNNRSILPSSSAPNWASMFMGVGPELHGYTTWGSKTPEIPPYITNQYGRFPGFYGLLRDTYPKAECGYIYEWEGMRYLVDSVAINYFKHAPQTKADPEGATSFAVNYIKEKKPMYCAVIFEYPDHTGHTYKWESKEYYEKLDELDGYLGQIVKAIEEAGMIDDTVIILTADHGGINTGHGGITLNEMETPLVFYGKGVKKGFKIKESTMVIDVPATEAWLLGIEPHEAWLGNPVTTAFQTK